GFTVVNVADGANVAVRLASVKMFFCHFFLFFSRRFIASSSRELHEFPVFSQSIGSGTLRNWNTNLINAR
ncbi:hypothetical protein, partial [Fibrobacter succinogenes]|uniref:hypothetical protein n=1 Tax=Fibrobacter succinogenes TaxID=833 RepID=UPI00350E3A70